MIFKPGLKIKYRMWRESDCHPDGNVSELWGGGVSGRARSFGIGDITCLFPSMVLDGQPQLPSVVQFDLIKC